MKSNVFEYLSWECLLFFLSRTDFHEPWMGFGFSTNVINLLVKAAKEKAKNDVVMQQILQETLEKMP